MGSQVITNLSKSTLSLQGKHLLCFSWSLEEAGSQSSIVSFYEMMRCVASMKKIAFSFNLL